MKDKRLFFFSNLGQILSVDILSLPHMNGSVHLINAHYQMNHRIFKYISVVYYMNCIVISDRPHSGSSKTENTTKICQHT